METFVKALGVSGETILVLTISFVVLILILKKLLFKPIMGFLDSRTKEIKDNFEQIENGKKDIEGMKTKYQEEFERIEKTAYDKMQEAIKEGLAAKTEIMSDAHNQAEKVLTKATEEIKQEKEKALVELKKEVINISIQTTQKVIGKNMDEKTNQKLVDEFISDLKENN